MNPTNAEAMHEAQQDAQAAYDEALDDTVAAIEADPDRVTQALCDYGTGAVVERAVAYVTSAVPTDQHRGLLMLCRIVRDAACEAARVELEQERRDNECSR